MNEIANHSEINSMTTQQGMLELADRLDIATNESGAFMLNYNQLDLARTALRQAAAPQGREALITDEMVERAYNHYVEAASRMVDCPRCNGHGYHHGFGEDGHDPDWCDMCGGLGVVGACDEMSAMREALKEVARSHQAQESGER